MVKKAVFREEGGWLTMDRDHMWSKSVSRVSPCKFFSLKKEFWMLVSTGMLKCCSIVSRCCESM